MKEDKSLTVADMAALGKLFEEHRTKLLAMLSRRIDPGLAVRLAPDDILSDAFLEAGRKWNAFKDQSGFTSYSWLYRIVLDCMLQAWRRESRGKRDVRRDMPWPERSSMQLGMLLVSPGTAPSEAVRREESRQQIRQIMDLLGDRDQEILWMRHFDQLSFKEIADVLGIKQSAANVRYARALKRLKDLWQKIHKQEELDE